MIKWIYVEKTVRYFEDYELILKYENQIKKPKQTPPPPKKKSPTNDYDVNPYHKLWICFHNEFGVNLIWK